MKNLAQLADDVLVKLYAEGNNGAFNVLLERYQDKVFSYILFVVRNQEVADDIFQDTFMKAIVTIQQGRYVENGKFQAWLTRIAHNLIIDFFRQTKNENCVSNDEVEYDLFNDVKLTEANVETKMVHEQVLDDVKLLIEHLPQNQKEVVFMRYYQGLSFKEIAEVTGVSINTALGRMRYALLNLRRLAVKKELHLAI
ncbi:MAG: sigma-70 family RNA polymerase sigma factor [Paraprevotella sp.]|jgi:RNA polymerase sigma-70 factor (ECF subfamily)|nr:sigma-70 family RNA polymerase sigma factor [Paraprevotella sp.]